MGSQRYALGGLLIMAGLAALYLALTDKGKQIWQTLTAGVGSTSTAAGVSVVGQTEESSSATPDASSPTGETQAPSIAGPGTQNASDSGTTAVPRPITITAPAGMSYTIA